MNVVSKSAVFNDLKSEVLRLQGFPSEKNTALDIGLGHIKTSFPNAAFPLGAVHEFLSAQTEYNASTSGFIAAVLSSIMGTNGVALWISSSRMLFPPALKSFGVEPHRFIFIDLLKEKEVLWAMNEALKCNALSAVVGEIREIDFKTSRRLQLAVEQSRVTGFIIRSNYKHVGITACVSRWKITSIRSEPVEDLPGVGFPKWKVELLRIRNGKPGMWDIQWINGRFVPVYQVPSIVHEQEKKVG
jgi:protein ImuA